MLEKWSQVHELLIEAEMYTINENPEFMTRMTAL